MKRRNRAEVILLAAFAIAISGCTSVFFQPSRERFTYLENDRLTPESVSLKSSDGTMISAWRFSSVEARRDHPEIIPARDLRSDEVRGVAIQFHGNAENMTSHYQFMHWLLYEGWDVLTFDYRGYGKSEGDPANLRGVQSDGVTALKWANTFSEKSQLPLVVFGQSLGASIAISSLQEYHPAQLKLLIFDSAFYSFTSIAQEKLSSVWFLWPFQWLGNLLVSNELSAAPRLENALPDSVFQKPAIFLHSERDPVVSIRQGEKLYAAYPGPKVRWTTAEPGHVNTLFADLTNDVPPKSRTREKLKIKLRELQRGGASEPENGPHNEPVSKPGKKPTSR